MELEIDPFPLSLPQLDGTRILGQGMNDAMEENGFDFNSMNFESPDSNLYWDDATSYQSTAKPNGNSSSAERSTILDTSFSQSPESSLPDSSSSDSSQNQHKRNHSSDSSQYGVLGGDGDGDGDIQMTGDTPMANGIVIGAGPVEDHSRDKPSPATDVDLSNRAMECHFDFDSAASSPCPYSDSKPAHNESNSTKPIKMPYRNSQKAGYGHGFGPYAGAPKRSPDTSLSSVMRNKSSWSSAVGYTPQPAMGYSGQFINGAMLSGSSQTSDWQYPVPARTSSGITPGQSSTFQQHAMALPFAPPATVSILAQPSKLHIAPLPIKSRVETQIPIKMTIYPPPSGITRLHLQAHTVSKSKLVAKPPPEKAPDMLEVHATLVCTSAMQDPIKRARALSKASEFPYIKAESRHSSSGDTTSPEDDEDKPLNGGPVRICQGCIERERKRAARKKTKNVEEEQLWQKDESKRIIVFNTQEVKEWQHPSSSKTTEAPRTNSPSDDPEFPENALQVEIPMRIACYCRHQEEKVGFQVIFTIRDHQGQMIAQEMTNPIVITDDHKTHAPPGTLPPQSTILPDGTQFSGSGVFSQATPGIQATGQYRYGHAYSTTDLQGMQHQHFNAQHFSPFAVPQHASQTTSATMTPKSLSRQASPSAPSGQQNKKRKASGSGRLRNDLTMTKLQTTTALPGPDPGTLSNPQSIGPCPGAVPFYVADYDSPHGLPMPSQFSTGPPTPSTADGSFFSSAQRSQSMENLQGFTGMFSAPSSVRPSRAPSPNAASYGTVQGQTYGQILTNPLHAASGTAPPQLFPVIHKMTPAEGSILGGIEVTCLGSGFRQGLEVMFGDALATTTTYWGESALVCLVPPAKLAGTVPVTFRHNSTQRISTPPNKQVFFRYVDDGEQELMKQALALISRKFTGNANDPSESARHIIDRLNRDAMFMGGSNHGSSQARPMPNGNAMSGTVKLEPAILSCLNLVDLDDSPYLANINARGAGGQTMLHISASLGYYRLAAGLLARGANPDSRDNNGMSPMHIASLRGHPQIIRKLRSSGGDPTLRSLNGYTSADMATSQHVRDASNVIEHHHRRTKSAGATPLAYLSRSSSMRSVMSSRETQSRIASAFSRSCAEFEDSGKEGFAGRYQSQPATPAQAWARSRRNSLITEQQYSDDQPPDDLASNAPLFATNPAWRDQLLAQIQQLQQSLHRTLPTLQIPALPPIPDLGDYQAYPVVRRISSLVPQRTARPRTPDDSASTPKEADYRWWELFSTHSPPSYNDIYPENTQQGLSDKKTSTLLAVGETFMDRKCETSFDQAENSSVIETVNLGSASLTCQQQERLKKAHAKKVKKLRSDRNLFFVWLPLLFFVLVMMLKDRVPQVLNAAGEAIRYAQDRYQLRAAATA